MCKCIVCGKTTDLRIEFPNFHGYGICSIHWYDKEKILRSLEQLNFELFIFNVFGLIPSYDYFVNFTKDHNLDLIILNEMLNLKNYCNENSNEDIFQPATVECIPKRENKIISRDDLINLQINLNLNDLSTPEQIEKFFQGV